MSVDVVTLYQCERCGREDKLRGAHAEDLPNGWLKVLFAERTTYRGSPADGRFWDRHSYIVCSRACAAGLWAYERADDEARA